MSKPKRDLPAAKPAALFDRIVSILEQARGNVVRAVNTNMVLAYWLIGRGTLALLKRLDMKPDLIVQSETPTFFANHQLVRDIFQDDPFLQ